MYIKKMYLLSFEYQKCTINQVFKTLLLARFLQFGDFLAPAHLIKLAG